MDAIAIGKRIKEKREENNLTQEQLGEKVHVAQQSVQKWEKGISVPEATKYEDIARALHTSVRYLLEDDYKDIGLDDEIFDPDHMFTRLLAFAEAEHLNETRKALYYARQKHKGQFRKTSIYSEEPVPYMMHPLIMACQAHAMGIREDIVLAVILLHDVCEDCHVEPEELPFSSKVRRSVALLTKHQDPNIDKKIATEQYYRAISKDSIASLVKVIDRCNNVSLMALTFKRKKLEEYILETETYVIPLLNHIKHNDLEYNDAAFLIKYQIRSQLETIKALLNHCGKF